MNDITISRGGTPKTIPIWPPNQKIETFIREPTVLVTNFDDTADVHPGLIAAILEREQNPEFSHRPPMGGAKIRHIERWGVPEIDLIHQRALALYSQVSGNPEPAVDLAWANVSRKGEYLAPHSHTRALGSVVYCVQTGDPDPNPLHGKLSFCDPRVAACCPDESEAMTNEIIPHMPPGTMILFPAAVVHFVHPYYGETPRITIAWNLR